MRVFPRLLVPIAIVVVLAPLPACKNNGQPAQTTTAASTASVTVRADDRRVTFRVELALTPEAQNRGLMFRKTLGAGEGMLFVFDRTSVHNFWMRNTLIPLDMLFIAPDRRIVGIVENAEPQTETARSVGIPSQYVLEIGGGVSGKLGIHAGQSVDFEGVPAP